MPPAQQPETPEPPGPPPQSPPDPTVPPPYEEPPRPIPIPRPDEPPVIDDPPPRRNAQELREPLSVSDEPTPASPLDQAASPTRDIRSNPDRAARWGLQVL